MNKLSVSFLRASVDESPSSPSAHRPLDEQWQYYIETGSNDICQVREVILRSWQRCYTTGVDPLNQRLHRHLEGEGLAEALSRWERLISVARPFMTDLYAIVRGSGFVVVLTDEDGFILELYGDDGAGETPMTSNFFVGASWHERDAGTNAIGTAIEEGMPVQVSGAEHYCRKHHCLTCSAAPIFDPEERLIGILDISGGFEGAHLHTLGMVVAAAKRSSPSCGSGGRTTCWPWPTRNSSAFSTWSATGC